jgi:hypothetical protein
VTNLGGVDDAYGVVVLPDNCIAVVGHSDVDPVVYDFALAIYDETALS